MKALTKMQVISMHGVLISETGGEGGLRDEGLLESALAAPFQTFDGVELFGTLQQKAARLACGLIHNHPFVDGNKRIGAHAMLVFLALNGISLNYTQDDLAHVFLKIAAGELDYEGLLEWLTLHEQ